jgi:glucose-1-phosphate thymidylyltransferase
VRDVVGLVPAAGKATRIGRLPCSKEIWPVGFRRDPPLGPIVSAEYLLDAMAEAGVGQACVVLRRGKWDIPDYFSEWSRSRPALAFIITEETEGVADSIDRAYPWIRGRTVAFGFPDIIFHPRRVFTSLLDRLETSGADVTLGLYPVTNPWKMDMVEMDGAGRITEIVIKPEHTELRLTWIHGVWRPTFTDYLHRFLAEHRNTRAPEFHAGVVIQGAMDAGLAVNGVTFGDGHYLDIGTPEDLGRAGEMTRVWAGE